MLDDESSTGFELTRRRILGGIGTIGAASAAAGAGTMAYFSDTEQSTGNTVSAGTLDLNVDSGNTATETFSLTNKAPGDTGTATTNLSNVGSLDGYLAFSVGDATNHEHGTNDPESSSPMELAGSGELGKWLKLRMGYADDGSSSLDDSEVAVEGYLTGSGSSYSFPNTGGMENVRFNQNALLSADGGAKDFVVEWEIDSDAGNEIQSDEVHLDFEFELMQKQADRQVVLDADTVYVDGKGFNSSFNPTASTAHVGSGSWRSAAGGQSGLYFGSEFSDLDALPVPAFSDIEEVSYWMNHSNSLNSDFFLQILTKPRGDDSDFTGWYNARYTAVPPNSNDGNPDWTQGAWNEFGTASTAQNQLYFHLQDNQNVSVTPQTLADLQSTPWNVDGHEYPRPDDEVLAFAIMTNSAQPDFSGYLDDIYLRTAAGDVSIDLEP
jgi:spore coat-associated protein N